MFMSLLKIGLVGKPRALIYRNYTDTWLGFRLFCRPAKCDSYCEDLGFIHLVDYSGLSQRTDWGGEIGMEYPT